MGALGVILLVVGILAVQAVVWIVIIGKWRKLATQRTAAALAELAKTGERAKLGPTRIWLRRGHVSTMASAVLTETQLIAQSRTSTVIPLASIQSARVDRWFNREARGGWMYVILTLPDGELGVQVRTAEHAAWADALRAS